MGARWLRIGVLAGVLFAVNAAGRLVGRLAYGGDGAGDLAGQERLGWLGWAAVIMVMAVTAGWWARQRPQGEVAAELAAGAGAAGLLYVVVGPFISAPPRFEEGLSGVIVQLTIYLGVAAVGALIGFLVMVAAGRDHRSRQLRSYAEARTARPRRPVRG